MQGNYNLFDVERNFQPVKVFEAEVENDNPIAVFSHDSRALITTGAYTNTINIYDLTYFFKRGKIQLKNSTIKSMTFSTDDTNLSVLGVDGKFRIYGIRAHEAVLLREVTSANKVPSNTLAMTGNKRYLLTGGDDHLVRVWDLFNNPGDTKKSYPQSGHSTAVTSALFSGDNNRVFTGAGDEGIFIWAFKGDLNPQAENNDLESFSRLSPIGNITPKKDKETSKLESEADKLADQIFDKGEEIRT